MSADAEVVPVAWHIGPIFKLGSEKPGRFGADDSRWQPLYSADTIAALIPREPPDVDAILRSVGVMRVVDGYRLEPKIDTDLMRRIVRATWSAAIDAAQSTEYEVN